MENEENKNVMEEATESTAKRGRKPVEKTEEKVVEKIVEKVVESPENQKRIEELETKLATMMDLMTKFMANGSQTTQVVSPVSNLQNEVKIVHLVQRAPGLSTYIKLSNLEVILTEFGEERYLTVQQFEEMLGKYRRWFDSGMISLADGYEDIARRYGLKTANNYPLDSYFISNMGTLPMAEIEKMYDRLPTSGKDFIISHWMQKVIEGDPNFKDIRKIETLDRISNGAMENVLVELKRKK
jgi:hypothetical protein